MNMDRFLSVVIPAYNEQSVLPHTVKAVCETLSRERIPFEMIFVDDGSQDGTWECIRALSGGGQDARVRGLRLSRHFGKDPSIFAGLCEARGACVAVMDCDLQHPPETLAAMYRLWEQGWQVVSGIKQERTRESGLHRALARAFNAALGRAAGVDMQGTSDFILLDRAPLEAVLSYREQDAFFRVIASLVGFRRTRISFSVAPRAAGNSKWSFVSLLRYAMQGITAFSGAPLAGAWWGAALFSSAALVSALTYAFSGEVSGEWIGIMLLLACAWILAALGVLGGYVYKLYRQAVNRPRFLIAERSGCEDEEVSENTL